MKINVKQINIEIIECDNIIKRLLGFMFKRKKITYGLRFKKCNSIHTFFMFQPIDVIMTDINDNILYTYENLENKIIWPKKTFITHMNFLLEVLKIKT